MSFTFNGINCESFGMYVEEYPHRVAPKRKRKFISIPGRSGDLTETEDAYENVTDSYKVFLKAGASFSEACRMIAEWLLFPRGYAVLTDTYNTGYFREAVFTGPLDIESELNEFGRATITFNRKPFLYRDDYLNKCVFAATGADVSILLDFWPEKFKTPGLAFYGNGKEATIINPMSRPSKPRIFIIGNETQHVNGSLTIGNEVFLFNDMPQMVLIDCEAENVIAAENSESAGNPYNGNSIVPFREFPTLPTGSVNIKVSDEIAAIIDPRWYTI